MNSEKPKKKRIETSKALLLYSDTITSIVLIVSLVAVFISQNPEPLAYLIPAVFGLSATSHGFYYWKAKAENLNKWGQSNKIYEGDVEDES